MSDWLVPGLAWAALVAALAWSERPSPPARILAVCAALALPAWGGAPGIASTALTVFAVVLAMRVVDWEALDARGPWERALWLVLPVVRRRPQQARARAAARRRAPRHVGWAALYAGVWGALALAFARVPQPAPRWAESTMAILFFVLVFASAAELAIALSLLLGAEVQPVFERPLVSRSLREFWSRRWNRFVSRFLLKHVALRLPRGTSPLGRTLAVFTVSGLLHEYFAWGAAGDGYAAGWMLAFFFVQGVAVAVEDRLPAAPRPLGVALTFGWMVLTAPWFFRPVGACMPAFGYPSEWIP